MGFFHFDREIKAVWGIYVLKKVLRFEYDLCFDMLIVFIFAYDLNTIRV